jgi:hypothetical protein
MKRSHRHARSFAALVQDLKEEVGEIRAPPKVHDEAMTSHDLRGFTRRAAIIGAGPDA